MFTIKVKERETNVKLNDLRKTGEIPAVFYGAGYDSTPVSVFSSEFKRMWRQAGESSTIQILTKKGNIDALIHEVQLHPITNEPIHVDFLAIDMNKKISVSIPLKFVGISNAVKSGLGILVKVLHEIEIEALPKDLPKEIEVDISKLETTEDQILVSDILLPEGVVAVTKMEEVIASIALQQEEKEETEKTDLSDIEVEKKGKKEEESEEESEKESEEKEDSTDK